MSMCEAWMNNRGTALAILQEMKGVAGEIQRGHYDRNIEFFIRDRKSGSRRIEDPLRNPVDVGRRKAGSLEPFNRQQGLVFQRGGSLPPQEMDVRELRVLLWNSRTSWRKKVFMIKNTFRLHEDKCPRFLTLQLPIGLGKGKCLFIYI
jgi:hypothetical protein